MSQFTDSLHDLFADLGRVEIRRMFGGHGVWHDGLMCALVAGDTLYLKADAGTAAHFDALALPAFGFRRGDRLLQTSYRQAPEAMFEDREAAALWSRRAFEAALRAANSKPVPKPAAKKRSSRRSPRRRDGGPAPS